MKAATVPIGALLAGAVGQLVGNRLALLLAAAYLACGIALLANPSLRSFDATRSAEPPA